MKINVSDADCHGSGSDGVIISKTSIAYLIDNGRN